MDVLIQVCVSVCVCVCVWCGVVWCGVVWLLSSLRCCLSSCCCCCCLVDCRRCVDCCTLTFTPVETSFGYLLRWSWPLLSCVRACNEILTTLTFGAPRRNHTVSTAFVTITKTNAQDRNKENPSSTCGQKCIMNRQEHNRSCEGKCVSVGVDALAVVW